MSCDSRFPQKMALKNINSLLVWLRFAFSVSFCCCCCFLSSEFNICNRSSEGLSRQQKKIFCFNLCSSLVVLITYSSSLQVSGFSILYPFLRNCSSSLLCMVGYGVPPDMMIYTRTSIWDGRCPIIGSIFSVTILIM